MIAQAKQKTNKHINILSTSQESNPVNPNANLENYLKKVNLIDLLSPDEEIDLVKRIQQGDQQAYDFLVYHNLRFVVAVAKDYQNQGLEMAELINVGNLGLAEAGKKYDPAQDIKFITYIVWWIRQSILRALADNKNK